MSCWAHPDARLRGRKMEELDGGSNETEAIAVGRPLFVSAIPFSFRQLWQTAHSALCHQSNQLGCQMVLLLDPWWFKNLSSSPSRLCVRRKKSHHFPPEEKSLVSLSPFLCIFLYYIIIIISSSALVCHVMRPYVLIYYSFFFLISLSFFHVIFFYLNETQNKLASCNCPHSILSTLLESLLCLSISSFPFFYCFAIPLSGFDNWAGVLFCFFLMKILSFGLGQQSRWRDARRRWRRRRDLANVVRCKPRHNHHQHQHHSTYLSSFTRSRAAQSARSLSPATSIDDHAAPFTILLVSGSCRWAQQMDRHNHLRLFFFFFSSSFFFFFFRHRYFYHCCQGNSTSSATLPQEKVTSLYLSCSVCLPPPRHPSIAVWARPKAHVSILHISVWLVTCYLIIPDTHAQSDDRSIFPFSLLHVPSRLLPHDVCLPFLSRPLFKGSLLLRKKD